MELLWAILTQCLLNTNIYISIDIQINMVNLTQIRKQKKRLKKIKIENLFKNRPEMNKLFENEGEGFLVEDDGEI